jgi:hypothetical protein
MLRVTARSIGCSRRRGGWSFESGSTKTRRLPACESWRRWPSDRRRATGQTALKRCPALDQAGPRVSIGSSEYGPRLRSTKQCLQSSWAGQTSGGTGAVLRAPFLRYERKPLRVSGRHYLSHEQLHSSNRLERADYLGETLPATPEEACVRLKPIQLRQSNFNRCRGGWGW